MKELAKVGLEFGIRIAGCGRGQCRERAETGAAVWGWRRGLDRRQGAARDQARRSRDSALRTTSITCLGVQLALERHLVAPAFQASCTMLVR